MGRRESKQETLLQLQHNDYEKYKDFIHTLQYISSSSFHKKKREGTVTISFAALRMQNSIFSHSGGEEVCLQSKIILTNVFYIITNF